MMPEICHSFVSRYAAIALAARNERERPVLLASFSSLFLVERFTRTENVSVFICIHCITRTEMCYEAVRNCVIARQLPGDPCVCSPRPFSGRI